MIVIKEYQKPGLSSMKYILRAGLLKFSPRLRTLHLEPIMHWIFLPTTILLCQALAHSWNEQLTVIENGFFTGCNSYPRGYISRSDPGFNDNMMTYLLPPLDSGRTRVNDSDLVCSPTQESASQTDDYPRLSASPRAYVAMKYLENGHVTLP